MKKINFKFAILYCLLALAGSSLVQCDDRKDATPLNRSCGSHHPKPRGGCCYHGNYIAEAKTLRVSSCESCTCECGKPICQVLDCAIPPEGCYHVQTATECCKLVCNKGCTYNGISNPEGQTKTVAPCQYGTCDRGKVMIAIADCAPLKPGCRYESSMEQCCKEICDLGCTYNGIFIPEGQSKTVAPCQYAYCSGGNVAIAIADCAPLEPGCRYESTLEQCCKKICDRGCNYNGIFIAEGQSKVVAPCQYAYCSGAWR